MVAKRSPACELIGNPPSKGRVDVSVIETSDRGGESRASGCVNRSAAVLAGGYLQPSTPCVPGTRYTLCPSRHRYLCSLTSGPLADGDDWSIAVPQNGQLTAKTTRLRTRVSLTSVTVSNSDGKSPTYLTICRVAALEVTSIGV